MLQDPAGVAGPPGWTPQPPSPGPTITATSTMNARLLRLTIDIAAPQAPLSPVARPAPRSVSKYAPYRNQVFRICPEKKQRPLFEAVLPYQRPPYHRWTQTAWPPTRPLA